MYLMDLIKIFSCNVKQVYTITVVLYVYIFVTGTAFCNVISLILWQDYVARKEV